MSVCLSVCLSVSLFLSLSLSLCLCVSAAATTGCVSQNFWGLMLHQKQFVQKVREAEMERCNIWYQGHSLFFWGGGARADVAPKMILECRELEMKRCGVWCQGQVRAGSTRKCFATIPKLCAKFAGACGLQDLHLTPAGPC